MRDSGELEEKWSKIDKMAEHYELKSNAQPWQRTAPTGCQDRVCDYPERLARDCIVAAPPFL